MPSTGRRAVDGGWVRGSGMRPVRRVGGSPTSPGRWPPGTLLRRPEALELGADRGGVGVVKVGEDGEGLLPGIAGGGGVAGGVMGVTEVGEHVGFVVAVAEVPKQHEGVLVAGDGFGVVAEVVVGVAQAVPGVGLPDAVVQLLQQSEGLLAGDEGLLVVAELGVVPADVVERLG